MKRYLVIAALLALTTRVDAQTDFDVRIPSVNDPTDAIEVFLDLTSARTEIASLGARLTYDSAAVTLANLAFSAGLPSNWVSIFQDTSVAGQVDIVLTDIGQTAQIIPGPVNAFEVLQLTFSRNGINCDTSAYDFNAAPPAPGPPTAAFPVNQFIIYVDGGVVATEAANSTAASGPTTGDHAFIRGNINNRSAGIRDIGDLVDLVNILFGGIPPGFDCQAAIDVNNDGSQNIVDVIALSQGVFGTSGFTIPPPGGVPGVVVGDGGAIPSVSTCAQGEQCF